MVERVVDEPYEPAGQGVVEPDAAGQYLPMPHSICVAFVEPAGQK